MTISRECFVDFPYTLHGWLSSGVRKAMQRSKNTKTTLVMFLFYLIRFFLLREWENNKESLLTFLEQVHMGIKGSGNDRLNPSLETISENQCCWSVTLWYGFGSGSGSCSFRQVAFKMPTKKFVCLLLFEGTFIPVLKDKKNYKEVTKQ